MDKKPIILSVSGISGGGKTTLVRALEQVLHSSVTIEFDSYDDMLHKDFFDWSDRGADYDEWDLSPMIADVEQAVSQGPDYIILDYPFGYGNREMARYIDFAAYVDTPLDVAMARRLLRDYLERDPNRRDLGDMEQHMKGCLKAYLAHDRQMYTQHIDTIMPYVDLVVDGCESPAKNAQAILERLKK